jgi:hypothetical protein
MTLGKGYDGIKLLLWNGIAAQLGTATAELPVILRRSTEIGATSGLLIGGRCAPWFWEAEMMPSRLGTTTSTVSAYAEIEPWRGGCFVGR